MSVLDGSPSLQVGNLTAAGPRNTPKADAPRYHIKAFTREQDPLAAVRVEQIHAEAYLAAGYVHPSAVDDFGRLDNSNPQFVLDKARGSTDRTDVLYLHATPAKPIPGCRDEGGLRTVNITETASLDDLGAFSACQDSIGPMHRRRLYDRIEKFGCQGVNEITSLSMTNDAHTTASYALIREVLHRALYHQTNEYWLITFAMPGYLKMRKKFGDRTMPQIGQPFYAHRNDDPRTSNELLLVPSIVETSHFFEHMVESMFTIGDAVSARKLFDHLRYMTEGLDDEFFTPMVRQVLSQ